MPSIVQQSYLSQNYSKQVISGVTDDPIYFSENGDVFGLVLTFFWTNMVEESQRMP